MNLARLTLWFERRGDGPVQLRRTTFQHRDLAQPLRAERGAYDGTFKWSSGVKSMMLFLLRSAAEALRHRQQQPPPEDIQPYVLEGKRPSPAASLNDVLTKTPAWVYDVFGTTDGGLPFVSEVVKRQNPDFSSQPRGDVSLWLDPERFSASSIEVKLNGRAVRNVRELDQLADDIARQWRPARRSASVAVGERDPATILSRYQAVSADNVEQHFGALLELLDEDVEFSIAGIPEWGMCGRWRGRQRVAEVISANAANMEIQEPKVHTLVSDESQFVVMAQERAKQKGEAVARIVEWVHTLTFENGKIVRASQLLAPSPESDLET